VFSGGLKEWRANPSALTWTGLSLFGGLILMFGSLLLARGFERTSPNLRRLLYGYNAVLGAILLVAVLGLINVLPYTRVGPFKGLMRTYDWTAGGIYSLSDKSRNLVAELKQPVTVYVLLSGDDRATHDVEAMLESCRHLNTQFTWKSISRDRMRTDFNELLKKYPVQEPYGLLVVYGVEAEGKEPEWDFIKYDDLVTEPSTGMRGMPSAKYTFKGENALMKTLVYLSEGKTRAVVYFTQGNGELDLDDRSVERVDAGLGVLSERIGKSNFDVKPLRFGTGTREVPADADAVIVVRPGGGGVPMSEDAVKALTEYMDKGAGGKKGKMMVLFDVVALPNGAMLQTGLEPLVEKFGVKPLNDRVLALDERHMFVLGRRPQAIDIIGIANSRSANAIARAYAAGSQLSTVFFNFENARSLETVTQPPGGGLTADVIVQTPSSLPVILQKDLAGSPQAVVADLRKPENRDRLEREIAERPVPLGIAVTEGKDTAPQMPFGHPPVNKDAVPRLLVFGDATWVSNQALSDRLGRNNYDLFLNGLTWLRERPNIGWDAQDKERQDYQLELSDDAAARLKMLPASLMLLVVLCLACGVWIVRRR
jgi:hypothetical protein